MMARKVESFIIHFIMLSFLLVGLTKTESEIYQHVEPEIPVTSPDDDRSSDQMDTAFYNIRASAELANKLSQEGVQPTDDIEQLYVDMIASIDELIEMVKEPVNAYKFLKTKGTDKVIIPNLGINYSKLKGKLLILLKTLFKVAPKTTDVIIPISVIDRLLDIFENDNNLAMKAHALDILYIWLPENPKAQVRVMKLKGLEPFYHQMSKLDTSVISTLLDLFNKILAEHIRVLSNRRQASKLDSDTLILYQRIGLIERMSTPTVCNGLLNIFENSLSYSNADNDVIAPVFQLIKNMKPYCLNVLRGHNKAINLFEAFVKYVEDEDKKEYFATLNINATDVEAVLEDFISELKHPPVKDEF